MKKNILFSALLFGALLSCKKKTFTEEPIIPPTTPIELGYSKLTVEENKKALEKNGLDFIKKVDALPNENFIKLINRLVELDFDMMSNTDLGIELQSIAQAAQQKQIGGLLSAVTTNNLENTAALSEFFGIYTWDSKTSKWLKTNSTDKLEIHFPSTTTASSNDAVLTANYTVSKVKAQLDGDYFELPATTNVLLKVGNKEELKLTGVYEYKEDAFPTKIDIKLNLGTFAFLVSGLSDSKTLNTKVWLAKDNIELLNLATTGNLNESRPPVKDIEHIEEILKDANTTFDVMNIRITGQVNVKAIQEDYKANRNLPAEVRRTKEIATLNKNSSLLAVYKDKNEVFAKNEFVMQEVIFPGFKYDPETGAWVPHNYVDYQLEPRLVFNDQSKVSLKTFFGKGFTSIIDEFDLFSNRF
ncbi:hypothetical protein [Pedobacter gandavensis]|uniref:hypothetical protein n=1 Tax=Pedobacter gandavensis TaxID=2679963 RepID=UPI00292FEE95|nr:hypothetical protein [Pedobacter gandavensis]